VPWFRFKERMYQLATPLAAVKGIGPTLSQVFEKRGLLTVKDLLLFVPLRYEDRSQRLTIEQLVPNELVTLQATVTATNNYYKGRRSIQSATVTDGTGRLKLMWFNNKFIIDKLKKGESYLISGKLNDRGLMVQPVVEDVKDDTIHTDRLVPVYSVLSEIKQGSLRRILKHVVDHLEKVSDPLLEVTTQWKNQTAPLPLHQALQSLHFPDTEEHIVKARQRLALEELLSLMQKSHQIKETWKQDHQARAFAVELDPQKFVPSSVPFQLTGAQLKATLEVLQDLERETPMNRLLVGDVGSGKTVVAGIAAYHVIHQGSSAALIAPTQILAQQHANTFAHIFPHLPIELLTATSSKKKLELTKPSFVIGTHAVINQLQSIKPAFVVYDEQHRFGVNQRSQPIELQPHPHILTMSATPIPRSLMLTIFSHLDLSTIDELPAGRQVTKTWLVPNTKRANSLGWINQEITTQKSQAIIICPFIDPSNSAALENIAAVKDLFEPIQAYFSQQGKTVAMLHGRMKKVEQAEITQKLYQREIDVLVTTPIVEVGVDLPAASIIVIEAAERFGLASLHQLRGRVGRAGQQGYCLLFTNSKNKDTLERLEKFSKITNGAQLAELDLEHRGAGDIFGTQQHGFDELTFATWADVELIKQARSLFEIINQDQSDWQSFLSSSPTSSTRSLAAN
jgi:ATP-dependent DNA helicase RecG